MEITKLVRPIRLITKVLGGGGLITEIMKAVDRLWLFKNDNPIKCQTCIQALILCKMCLQKLLAGIVM